MGGGLGTLSQLGSCASRQRSVDALWSMLVGGRPLGAMCYVLGAVRAMGGDARLRHAKLVGQCVSLVALVALVSLVSLVSLVALARDFSFAKRMFSATAAVKDASRPLATMRCTLRPIRPIRDRAHSGGRLHRPFHKAIEA